MNTKCAPQIFTKLVLATIMFIGMLGMLVLGFTVAPLFGLMAAVPFGLMGLYFLLAHMSKDCEIGGLK